eukprot:jgi/Ulvmu1/9104/UM005_0199.1
MAQCGGPPRLIEELSKVDQVIDRARAVVAAAPSTSPVASTSGVTFQDAFQIVAKREEDKRKKSGKDSRKRAQADQLHFPGSRIGVDSEMSAYWMVMEDYCRTVQPADIQLLLPQFSALHDDPAFLMPPLGFNPTHLGQEDNGKDPSQVNGNAADIPAHSTARNSSTPAFHEGTGARRTPLKVEKLSEQAPGSHSRTGATLLHSVPTTCIKRVLSVLAALFPASGVDWSALSADAAASKSSTLAPDVVNRIRAAVAQLASSLDPDAAAAGDSPVPTASTRGTSPAANGANGTCASGCTAPSSAQDMLALNGFSYLSTALDEAKTAGDAALTDAIAGAVGAKEAQQAVVQLMQSSLTVAAERVLPHLPSLDLQSAIVPATQELDLGSCRAATSKPPVPPDETVHPYLAEFLKHATPVEPVMPTRRRSPAPAAPPLPPAEPGGAAAGQPRPAAGAAVIDAAAPSASAAEAGGGGVEPQGDRDSAGQAAAATLAGSDAQESMVVSARDGQAGAAAVVTPGRGQSVSVDFSSADDRATDAKDMLADDRPLRFTMQQRRSTRKRARPSNHISPVKSAPPSVHGRRIKKEEEEEGGEAEPGRPSKVQATCQRGRPVKSRASKRASAKALAGAKAELAPRDADDGPLASLAGSAALSAADTVGGGGGAGASIAAASEPAASGAASVHAPADDGPDATSGCRAAEQWELLNQNAELLAIAPEDEIVAEIVSLQSELAQVVVSNRRSCARLLGTVLPTLPAQAEARQQRQQAEEDIDAFLLHMKALKRQAKQEKRDAERRAAQEALEPVPAAAAEKDDGAAAGAVVPRARRATTKATLQTSSDDDDDDERSPDDVFGVPLPLRAEQLIDPFALETPDVVNALCAVCGDGTSVPSNQIVFCDRCNVPVHQQCYGLGEIPAGEWLCWPCKLHERGLREQGMPQDKIRPPRFKQEGSPDYSGGSKDVTCALCPVKRGIFKKTACNSRWVHLVCAHWQTPEVSVAQEDVAEAVHGIDTIRPERFSMTCAYCRQRTGATVKCSHHKCHTTFHPLCARKVGCFAVCKHSTGRGRPTYKTWCPQHGDAAQRREQELASQRAAATDNGDKRPAGGKGTRREAAAAAAAAVASDGAPAAPDEDIAALQKELAEKQEVHVFLKAVRYDMEAARNLAAQVETREKRKVQLAEILAQEYDMALSDPARFAPYHAYLSVGMHQRSVLDWVESTIAQKKESLKAKLHSSQSQRGVSGDPARARHSGGQVPIGAPGLGMPAQQQQAQQYMNRQPPPQPPSSGDFARMQGGMAAGQLAGLPPGGVGSGMNGPGGGMSMHDPRQPDFRLSAHGQPSSGGRSGSGGQLVSPHAAMRQGRQSPSSSRLLDDPLMMGRRHSYEHSMGSPSQSPAGLLDASVSQLQPGPPQYHGDGMHYTSTPGPMPGHRMSIDRGRMSSGGAYPGGGGGPAWMTAKSQRASGPGPFAMHGSRGSSSGYHPMQRPGSGAMPAERGMRSYAMPGGDAPRMMPDPSLQTQMHSGRPGERPGAPMMDPLVHGGGAAQGRHGLQMPPAGDMGAPAWQQRGGPGLPMGMTPGQRQPRGMHDMPYFPGSRGGMSPSPQQQQAMRMSALGSGGMEQQGAQHGAQPPPRSSRPQRAAAQIARQNNFAADPLDFMD